MRNAYKKCSCGREWASRNDFFADPRIELTGYMPNFDELDLGLILFLHKKNNCYSTIAIKTEDVRDLHKGPVFRRKTTGKSACPGYCLTSEVHGVCTVKCACRWVRDVLVVIGDWKKTKNRVPE